MTKRHSGTLFTAIFIASEVLDGVVASWLIFMTFNHSCAFLLERTV